MTHPVGTGGPGAPASGGLLTARLWHGLTAVVAGIALVVQVALVISGESVLVTTGSVPSTGTRLLRFFGYFTVQSNLLVLATTATLAIRPDRDGRFWRVARLAGLTGIAVTGIVHWFLLRPLLSLTGASYVTDKLLHVAVPVLATVGWLVFGPRPRVTWRDVRWALAWPAAYMVYTLGYGAAATWYPYPFVDVTVEGYAAVLRNGIGVVLLLLAVASLLRLADGRMSDRRDVPTAPVS